MKIVIVIEAIPPYCGGAEQVAWINAIELAKRHTVSIVTFGENPKTIRQHGLIIRYVQVTRRKFLSYSLNRRADLNRCIDECNPDVIHCHMPNVLSACLSKRGRVLISTIHDGVPENERKMSIGQWLKFKLLRRINIRKSDVVTCVSRHNLTVMQTIYPQFSDKFVFIPNPVHERFFSQVADTNNGSVLNFGRQIELKVGALIRAARLMADTQFVFVGVGDMVRDYGLSNIKFVGFSDSVEDYIDKCAICVFPSGSENFPLVGLEAMARGKPVIATRRGFSEYISHGIDGHLLETSDPEEIKHAITDIISNEPLRAAMGRHARSTAEKYGQFYVISLYEELYDTLLLAKSDS